MGASIGERRHPVGVSAMLRPCSHRTPKRVSFFMGIMGFEWPRPPSLAASQQFTLRPLRKHAGGMFLGRSRIHRFLNAPGTGVGRKRSWSQDCRMVEISIVSKSHKRNDSFRQKAVVSFVLLFFHFSLFTFLCNFKWGALGIPKMHCSA